MCFIHFIEEHHGIRTLLQLFSELTSFLMTHVPRRRTDKFSYLKQHTHTGKGQYTAPLNSTRVTSQEWRSHVTTPSKHSHHLQYQRRAEMNLQSKNDISIYVGKNPCIQTQILSSRLKWPVCSWRLRSCVKDHLTERSAAMPTGNLQPHFICKNPLLKISD